MQPDPEYLRRQYASLTDDALLEIRRSDLVEVAQKCYDAEVASRGLLQRGPAAASRRPRTVAPQASEPESETPAQAGDNPEWLDEAAEVFSALVVPGSQAAEDADNARRALEAAGIPCHLEVAPAEEEHSAAAVPPGTHRWRLLVPGNLNLRAASTLERDMFNEEFEAQWRAHLESLSDDEVLAMPPEVVLCGLFDRVDRASRAYDQEIARRGLTEES